MRNYPEWIIAFAAITSIGAIAVCLNAWWTADELAYGLEDSGSQVLVADLERAERAAPAAARLGVAVVVVRSGGGAAAAGACAWKTLLHAGRRRCRQVEIAPGRRRHHPLHQRHDGPSEGRRLDPPRRALGADGLRAAARSSRG